MGVLTFIDRMHYLPCYERRKEKKPSLGYTQYLFVFFLKYQLFYAV